MLQHRSSSYILKLSIQMLSVQVPRGPPWIFLFFFWYGAMYSTTCGKMAPSTVSICKAEEWRVLNLSRTFLLYSWDTVNESSTKTIRRQKERRSDDECQLPIFTFIQVNCVLPPPLPPFFWHLIPTRSEVFSQFKFRMFFQACQITAVYTAQSPWGHRWHHPQHAASVKTCITTEQKWSPWRLGRIRYDKGKLRLLYYLSRQCASKKGRMWLATASG